MALSSFIRISIIRFTSLFFSSKKSKVIFYHDIHSDKQYTDMSTPIKLFKRHIQFIRENGYEIVSEITENNRQIEICFDDGFSGFYDNIKIINSLEIPITIFVITSLIGSENYLTKTQIIELNENPLVNFQSHTHTHPNLPILSDKNLDFELLKSKKILEDICNKDVEAVCYPEGKFNNRVIDKSKNNGYTKQYSSIPGFYYNEFTLNVKKRSLVQFADEKEFLAILKGGDHILAIWYKFKYFIK